MVARVHTIATCGLTPVKVEVEINATQGIPGLHIIGLPSKTVDEAKERITAALMQCGVRVRAKRTVVNLAPADFKKEGSAFELAIAVGLLKFYGEVTKNTDSTVFFGELSLDGSIKPIKGVLPRAIGAKKLGFSQIVFPIGNAEELSLMEDSDLYPVKHLSELLDKKPLENKHTQTKPSRLRSIKPSNSLSTKSSTPNMAEVIGQEQAKRALTIAAAGTHSCLLTGPPGAGKSMLARAFITILEPLSPKQALESTSIHSLHNSHKGELILRPPLRTPHHSISYSGLVGGGSALSPGEISLAHNGVLFLDEFPEFSRDCRESLRQPLETGTITLARAQQVATYPAKFLLIATANPCPCGYFGSDQKPCSCTPTLRERYQQKLSGPILDRIDLHVRVQAVKLSLLHDQPQSPKLQTAQQLRQAVVSARKLQKERYHSKYDNSSAPVAILKNTARVEPTAQQLLLLASNKLSLSARAHYKVLRVARTIADLENSATVAQTHIAEAVQYRAEV